MPVALAMLQLDSDPPFDPANTLPQVDWLTGFLFFVTMTIWLAFLGWLIGRFQAAKRRREERRRSG
ncbi:MAG: hypothetical protein ACO1SX_01305 [Actinomycetota bacterium]